MQNTIVLRLTGFSDDTDEGHIGGIRHVITSKDIIMEMADLGAVGTGPPVPETAYAYHVRSEIKGSQPYRGSY